LITALPCAGGVTELRDKLSLSASLSLASTGMTTAVSSAVVARSLTATGPSFVPVTVTVTVPLAAAPLPSESV
jgi:hypothetical protein